MNDDILNILTKEILNTKSLSSLNFSYVKSKAHKFFLTNGDLYKKLDTLVCMKGIENVSKNKFFKQIVKQIRDELRVVYGSFLTDDFFKKDKIFTEIENEEQILELLKCHKSTRERINFYDEIYKKIFAWYKPQKIADIACGLNPLSYFIIKEKLSKNVSYFASDLSAQDMSFVQSFFNKYKIDGIAKDYDVTNLEILDDDDFQSCDLVFLFKALDSFEEVKKNISKEILLGINAKKVVVSFPTKSLISKIQFKIERRNWLFNFLNKQEWNYEQFEVENELFILISKS